VETKLACIFCVALLASSSTSAMTPAQPVELASVNNEVHLCLINPGKRATIPDKLRLTVSPHQGSQEFYLVELVRKSKWCYKLEPNDLLRSERAAVLDIGGGAAKGKINLRLAIRCNAERDSCLMFRAEKFHSTQSEAHYQELLELYRRAEEDE
jgi:hypothetical protein